MVYMVGALLEYDHLRHAEDHKPMTKQPRQRFAKAAAVIALDQVKDRRAKEVLLEAKLDYHGEGCECLHVRAPRLERHEEA